MRTVGVGSGVTVTAVQEALAKNGHEVVTVGPHFGNGSVSDTVQPENREKYDLLIMPRERRRLRT
jgi:hypothetical protein